MHRLQPPPALSVQQAIINFILVIATLLLCSGIAFAAYLVVVT
jgi:hypothetical protein